LQNYKQKNFGFYHPPTPQKREKTDKLGDIPRSCFKSSESLDYKPVETWTCWSSFQLYCSILVHLFLLFFTTTVPQTQAYLLSLLQCIYRKLAQIIKSWNLINIWYFLGFAFQPLLGFSLFSSTGV
jgi:hypothetical protein